MNWIKSKIFILPSTNEDRIQRQIYKFVGPHTNPFDRRMIGALTITSSPDRDKYECQHLYFTSDEEIKEGEWCFEVHNGPSLAPKDTPRFTDKEGNIWWLRRMNMYCSANDPQAKKIIATTDKNLYTEVLPFEPGEKVQYKYLPEPSKEFLEVYVKAYDEGKKIDEVLIEVEEGMDINPNDNASMSKMSWTYVNRIKVKPDNTITIKKVKDSWSRAEVIELLNKLGYDIAGNGYILDVNLKVKQSWIERNL